MSPRGAKVDRQATAEMGFKDPRSFRCVNGHDYLKGEDLSRRRMEVYRRDKGICRGCKTPHFVDWIRGEMHHKQGGLVGRCDDLANLAWVCGEYHRRQHVRPMWTRKG